MVSPRCVPADGERNGAFEEQARPYDHAAAQALETAAKRIKEAVKANGESPCAQARAREEEPAAAAAARAPEPPPAAATPPAPAVTP